MSVYDEQIRAGKAGFKAQRDAAKENIDETVYSMWGDLSGGGLTGGNIQRLRKSEAKARTLAGGEIDAAQQMWLANTRRAEQARQAQSTRNLWTTIGTGVGALGLGLLALPTGGLSLAALPGVLGAANAGAGLGGFLGGLGGGFATGEFEGNLPATMVSGLSAAGNASYMGELLKLQARIASLKPQSGVPYNPNDSLTWGK